MDWGFIIWFDGMDFRILADECFRVIREGGGLWVGSPLSSFALKEADAFAVRCNP